MLLLVLLGATQTLAVGTIRHARYECGVHGRFEYCIDNVPGCVIGCYCHPGYYFDTDTKICEHNTKLTTGIRRSGLYDTEILTISPPITPAKLNTKQNDTDLLDNKIDTITKDVDDLSDWLYKQFFKVVENQVINSTDEYDLMNRRIGHESEKKYRKRRSKKKNKKGRMMRITEDDSLFDSSDSRSGESDDSDYSDGDSWEEIPNKAKPKPGPKGNNNHGHRKIVMIHKKPKPPLPSFVFLPNSGTNFYPPVELQRPPIPMFPIVPVPPVLQPSLFPPPVFLIQQSSNNNNDNKTEKPSETCNKTNTTPVPVKPVKPDPVPVKPVKPDPVANKSGENDPGANKTGKPELRSRNQHQQDHKWLKNIQNVRATKKYINHLQPIDSMPETEYSYLSDQESPMKMGDSLMYESFRKSSKHHYTTESDADIVNFKYLADLIRNVNSQNELKNNNNKFINNNNNYDRHNNYYKSNTPPFERHFQRNNTFYRNNPIQFAPVTEENFYTKLGKEIANLVRKIESNSSGRHEVDIEIVPVDRNQPVIINENSYVSRSYWDRFARSPNIDITNNRLSNSPMNSNEALNELENIVQRTATVTPELTLTELESLIKIMDKNDPKNDLKSKQSKKIKNVKETRSQPSRINIRLYPPNSPPILKIFSDTTLLKPINKNRIRINTFVTAQPLPLNNKPPNIVKTKTPLNDNSHNKKISIRLSRIHQSKSRIDANHQIDQYNNKNYLMNSRKYNIITRSNQGTKTRKETFGNSLTRRITSPLLRAVSFDKYFTNSGMQEQEFGRPLEPLPPHKMFSSEVVYRNNKPMYFENDFNDFFNI